MNLFILFDSDYIFQSKRALKASRMLRKNGYRVDNPHGTLWYVYKNMNLVQYDNDYGLTNYQLIKLTKQIGLYDFSRTY